MENKPIYIGNGKKQKEDWLKSSFCISDIPEEHTFEYNGKKYIKVNINIKSEPDQYGKDVSITVDTWKPDGNGATVTKEGYRTQPVGSAPIDEDAPF